MMHLKQVQNMKGISDMNRIKILLGTTLLAAVGLTGCAPSDAPDVSVQTTIPVTSTSTDKPTSTGSVNPTQPHTDVKVGVKVLGAGSVLSRLDNTPGASPDPATVGAGEEASAVGDAVHEGGEVVAETAGSGDAVEGLFELIGALFGM